MHVNHNTKTYALILGTGVTNGATVTANIDTLGFDSVALDVIMGTADVVSNKPSVLKLAESDDTVVTNFADVTAFVGGGTGGFTIPSADTSNANIYRFNVDCRARKRYLRLSVSPRTTQAVVIDARLGRPEVSADTSTSVSGTQTLVNG